MIGSLDRRLYLQEPVRTPDDGGGFTTAFENISTNPLVYASIMPVSGAESLRAGQLAAKRVFRIILRWRGDVTTDMRLVEGGNVYAITSVSDVNARKSYLEIVAELLA